MNQKIKLRKRQKLHPATLKFIEAKYGLKYTREDKDKIEANEIEISKINKELTKIKKANETLARIDSKLDTLKELIEE